MSKLVSHKSVCSLLKLHQSKIYDDEMSTPEWKTWRVHDNEMDTGEDTTTMCDLRRNARLETDSSTK